MYILTEGGRNFKTLLKENYAIALDSYYLFTKKLSMELNMIYIDSTYHMETFLKVRADLIDKTFLAI